MSGDQQPPGQTLTTSLLPPAPRDPRGPGHQLDEPHAELRAQLDEALEQIAHLDPQDPRRAELRDQVVQAYLPLVRSLASRYRHREEPLDDLVQVGTIGLIHAVDRYDPGRGTALASYATVTIVGEIRRHLRDLAGTVRVPRRLQERRHLLALVGADLTQRLQRSPTLREIAAESGMDVELILETWEAQRARTTVHLDTTAPDDTGLTHHGEAWTRDDDALEHVLTRESLRPLLRNLGEREKRIIVLHFFRGLSQRQIAA